MSVYGAVCRSLGFAKQTVANVVGERNNKKRNDGNRVAHQLIPVVCISSSSAVLPNIRDPLFLVFLRFGLLVRFFKYIQQAWLDSSLSLRQFAKLPAEIVNDINKRTKKSRKKVLNNAKEEETGNSQAFL